MTPSLQNLGWTHREPVEVETKGLWLIVGLGNPGSRYRSTRHNVGFRVVDLAAERWNAGELRVKGRSLVVETECGQTRVALAKPQTYMNRSGTAVRDLMTGYASDSPVLVVVYDDFNLPLGKLRLRERGGPGGHNGMHSIVSHLDTEEFLRLRLGIADESLGDDASCFVLSEFPSSAGETVRDMVHRGVLALESLVTVGAEKTMSLFN